MNRRGLLKSILALPLVPFLAEKAASMESSEGAIVGEYDPNIAEIKWRFVEWEDGEFINYAEINNAMCPVVGQ